MTWVYIRVTCVAPSPEELSLAAGLVPATSDACTRPQRRTSWPASLSDSHACLLIEENDQREVVGVVVRAKEARIGGARV